MKSVLAAAFSIALPLGAAAQDSDYCIPYMESRQIAQPPADLSDDDALQIVGRAMLPFTFDISHLAGNIAVNDVDMPRGPCSPQQLAMLVMDVDAVAKARPVSDPEALYGTWLSDDVLSADAGFTVAGQEVLVIEPASGDQAEGGPTEIAFRQYWYRAFGAYRGSAWDADGNFTALVAQGVLRENGNGEFVQDRLEAPIDYTGITLIDERSEDLFIKGKLNVFDQTAGFAIDGDSLVLRYEARMPIYRYGNDQVRTYTRVDDAAPETALRMASALEVSQTLFFNCLTRKISAQDPALIEFLKPFSIDEVDELTRQAVAVNRARDELLREGRENGPSDDLRDRLIPVMDEAMEVRDLLKPLQVKLLTEGASLCPEPPRML